MRGRGRGRLGLRVMAVRMRSKEEGRKKFDNQEWALR